MAVWQICFYAIENNKLDNDADICYWRIEPEKACDINFLYKYKSWSKNIIQYGDLQESCIELFKENGKIVEISIRLDIRSLSNDMVINMSNYLNDIKANIYFRNKIIVPSTDNIVELIKTSDAYKYCNNPRLFIKNLGSDDNN